MNRKSIAFGILSLGLAIQANAQKYDENKVLLAISKNDFIAANDELAKAANDPKKANTPDVLALKTRVASDIVIRVDTVETLRNKYPNAATDFINDYNALKAAVPDTGKFNGYIRDNKTWAVSGIGKIYSSSFNNAVKDFNNKDYQSAFSNFKNADIYGGYLIDNGFTQNEKGYIDTTTIQYAGIAAQYLDSANHAYGDTAMLYYNRLLSKGISLRDAVIYDWIITYYNRNNDAENAAKYLAIAKKAFPDNMSYWNNIESKKMMDGKSPEALLKTFEDKRSGLTEDQYIAFGNAFSDARIKSKDPKQKKIYSTAQIEAYKGALSFQPSNLEYLSAIAKNYASQWNELKDAQTAVKGTSAESKAERLSYKNDAAIVADSAIKYLTLYYNTAKAKTDRSRLETSDLNYSVNALSLLYDEKKTASAGRNVADFKKYEALAKKYDAEYNKYK